MNHQNNLNAEKKRMGSQQRFQGNNQMNENFSELSSTWSQLNGKRFSNNLNFENSNNNKVQNKYQQQECVAEPFKDDNIFFSQQ